MAIIDRTGGGGESLTAGSRALDLFTDREVFLRRFVGALNDDPAPGQILFLTGDGGNGKSLLLRCMGRHYCRRLLNAADWAWVKTRTDEEFLPHVRDAENAADLPWTHLDFGMPPRGDDRPQEAFSALLMMMRGLTPHGLRFPLYEFACVWYLHKTERLTAEKLRDLFPSDVLDIITEIAGTVANTPWAYIGSSVLRIFDSQMSERYTLYQYARELNSDRIEEIQRMEPESELIDALPRLFAEDLNASRTLPQAPARVVLFFDTHEAFWGRERDLTDDLYFQYDEWLRCLLAHLEFARGIVVVCAGRERPRWHEAARFRIPEDCVEVLPVGHFRDQDAHVYLKRAGVADAAVRRTLIARARVNRNEVHPFYLGLCADLADAARRRGEPLALDPLPATGARRDDRGKALTDRLLRYVDQEIGMAARALCACRGFDRELYLMLGRALGFHATETSFDVLCRFSFVWHSPRGEAWHRLHDLLRRLVRDAADPVLARADAALERWYDDRARAGDPRAIAEAAYHAAMLDPERGADRWVIAFETAVQQRNDDVCRALIEVWTELRRAGDFARGRIFDAQGDFYVRTSDYEEADECYRNAIADFDRVLAREPNDLAAHLNRGNALLSLGELAALRDRFAEAMAGVQGAMAEFAEARRAAPDDPRGHVNAGNAGQRLGRLLAGHGEHAAALAEFHRADAAYADAIRLAPEDSAVWSNAGGSQQARAELLMGLGQGREAEAALRDALASYGQALRRSPDLVTTLNLRGVAHALLADLYERQQRAGDARAEVRTAMTDLERAVALAPGDAATRSNVGNVLQGLGDLEASLGRHAEAERAYRDAIAAYAEALQRAPESAAAHHNRATALHSLARLLASAGATEAAATMLPRAISGYQDTINRSPRAVPARVGKARALHALGDVLVGLGRTEAAVRTLRLATGAYDRALKLDPSQAGLYHAKGDALQVLAELADASGRSDQARRCYRRAIYAYQKGLKLAPHEVTPWCAKANAWQDLAQLYDGARPQEATQCRRRAVISYEEAQRLAPKDPELVRQVAQALADLAQAQDQIDQNAEAARTWESALAAYDRALTLGPDTAPLRVRRGQAWLGLGHVQAELGQAERVGDSLRRAVAELDRALALDPGHAEIRELREQLAATLEDNGDHP